MTLPIAYAEVRHGGVARSPVLVPLRLLDTVIEPKTYVSLNDGASQPDIEINFLLYQPDLQNLQNAHLLIILTPYQGKVLHDVDIRVVIWKHEPILTTDIEDGILAAGDQDYVVLGYQTTGTRPMPQVVLNFGTAYTPEPRRPGATGTIPADYIFLQATTVTVPEPLRVVGGMVRGPQRLLGGRRTFYDVITHAYNESPWTIKGVDLGKLASPPTPGATALTSTTWVDVAATNPTATPTHIEADIWTYHTATMPPNMPTVALDPSPGTLRPGVYAYKVAFLHQNGNESSPTPSSDPVTIVSGGDRSVLVSNLPVGPPPPANDAAMTVAKRIIYRTDRSELAPSGDDIKVGEVAGNSGGTFIDHGPGPEPSATDPDPPVPELRDQWIRLHYHADSRLDLDANVTLTSGGETSHYAGHVETAPTDLNVVFDTRGAQAVPPRARVSIGADATIPRARVHMLDFATPWGVGLDASLTNVPRDVGVDWRVHGDEHTAITAVAGADMTEPSVSAPGIDLAAVKLGIGATASGWPGGDATVAVDLVEPRPSTVTAGRGLIVGRGLRFAHLRVGDLFRRSVNAGRIRAHVLIGADPTNPPGGDRTLRARYSPAPVPPLPGREPSVAIDDLRLRARELPDRLDLDVFGLEGQFTLSSRVRFVRATAAIAHLLGADRVDVRAELDDTGDTITVTVDDSGIHYKGSRRSQVRADVRGLPLNGGPAEMHAEAVVPPTLDIGLAAIDVTAESPGVAGRVAMAWAPGVLSAASATPQARIYQRGASETDPRSPAGATVRVYGARRFKLPSSDGPGTRADTKVHVELDAARPNHAFRAVGRELDRRFRPEVADWARTAEQIARLDDRQRTWLRARTATLPDTLDVDIISESAALAGLSVGASSPWGAGAVWVEPGFAFAADPLVPTLGPGAAVGNIRADIDSLPANLMALFLSHAAIFTAGELDPANTFPMVEAPPMDFIPGGAAIRLDGPLMLSALRVAIPTGQEALCFSGSPSLRITWTELLAMMVGLEPQVAGPLDNFVWTFSQPAPAPSGSPPEPCGPKPAKGPDLRSGMGYRFHNDIRVTVAARLYAARTEHGARFSRWNMLGPTGQEPKNNLSWTSDKVDVNKWRLQYELQMKGYRGEITLYPQDPTDIPYGDWEAGPGNWWVRATEQLDIPDLFALTAGDAYFGNTGNGYHIIFTNGVFSTLARIFTWSYP